MRSSGILETLAFLFPKSFVLLLTILLSFGGMELSFAQENQDFKLARQFYNKKEYSKAIDLLSDLYKSEPGNGSYYIYYFYSLIQLQDYKEAEDLAHGQSRKFRRNVQYKVDEGYAISLGGDRSKAEKIYQGALDYMKKDGALVTTTARAFESRREFDYAIKAYLLGREMIGDDSAYSYELANLYNSSNNVAGMVDIYIDMLAADASQQTRIQNLLQSRLEEKHYDMIRGKLLSQIQEKPDAHQLSELMIWFYVQRKEFNAAFFQARALDKRLGENGNRVYKLAHTAVENEAYDQALKMYEYVSETSKEPKLKVAAEKAYLRTSFEKLVKENVYTVDAIKDLDVRYAEFLNNHGRGLSTVDLQQSHAQLKGIHLGDLDAAIEILDKAKEIKGLNPRTKASIKLALGDYYLMNGDIWEPTLLYGQVDKDFKDEPLGQEAKFRNARLSFYRGEFDWAQAQCDVLKASTSQKIANDAIDLYLLIQDNVGLDTTFETMELYAEAHLLSFRRRFDESTKLYDSLLVAYPYHDITDEVWFDLGKISEEQRDYQLAAKWYQKVVDEFGQDILADDALFRLASITEHRFDDLEKAMLLYQKILLDYPNSLFSIEARERYRALRGDFSIPQ